MLVFGIDNFELICYSDADFSGCKIDTNSTTLQKKKVFNDDYLVTVK